MIKYCHNNLYLRKDYSEEDTFYVGVSEIFAEKQHFIENVTIVDSQELASDEDFIIIDTDSETVDFYAPFKMEIVEVNELLEDDYDYILQDPEYDGWIVKVKCSSSHMDTLLELDQYEKHFEEGLEEYE